MQALWKDALNQTLYAYDGGLSYSRQVQDQPSQPANESWRFPPNGAGGSWDLVGPRASSNLTDLVRTYSGVYASSDEGVGFAFGGVQNSATFNQGNGGSENISGLVMFNSSTQDWLNISSSDYSDVATQGAAYFLSSFGPSGLLFVLGGSVGNGTLTGFDFLYFLEPISPTMVISESERNITQTVQQSLHCWPSRRKRYL